MANDLCRRMVCLCNTPNLGGAFDAGMVWTRSRRYRRGMKRVHRYMYLRTPPANAGLFKKI